MSNLLPPNQTFFEKNVIQVTQKNTLIDVDIKKIASIDQVNPDFLPLLAWQYSVDSWDNEWQPSLQRALIKKSFHQHQIKGTKAAIRNVLSQFGYSCTFVEWFEKSPIGQAGTFDLKLDLNGRELTEEVYQETLRLINDAKPISRHLINLNIEVKPICKTFIGIGQHIAILSTIYPKSN